MVDLRFRSNDGVSVRGSYDGSSEMVSLSSQEILIAVEQWYTDVPNSDREMAGKTISPPIFLPLSADCHKIVLPIGLFTGM